MKILVYEYVSGGGYAGQPIDPSVLSEGFGMLRSLAADFKAAGHEVTAFLDARLSKLNPPLAADRIDPVFDRREFEKNLLNPGTVDAVYIVAPETGQTLKSLVEVAERMGQQSLNCRPNAIEKVSNKNVLYETLLRRGVKVPETLSFDVQAAQSEVMGTIRRRLSYPLVFKPADGVSCGGLSMVQEDDQVEAAVEKVKAASTGNRFVVQEFVKGDAASVSLLCTGEKALVISLNRQLINLSPPQYSSSYEGGEVPLEHPLRAEAFKTAEKVAASFAGLQGYVGVDMVLAGRDVYVMDVNPRLTTSYVGLRRVAGFNVADAMVSAVLEKKLPQAVDTRGFACFSKVRTCNPTLDTFQEAAQMDGVVSPPFPWPEGSESCSLVSGHGSSCEMARLRFEEAKKRLFTIINGRQ